MLPYRKVTTSSASFFLWGNADSLTHSRHPCACRGPVLQSAGYKSRTLWDTGSPAYAEDDGREWGCAACPRKTLSHHQRQRGVAGAFQQTRCKIQVQRMADVIRFGVVAAGDV